MHHYMVVQQQLGCHGGIQRLRAMMTAHQVPSLRTPALASNFFREAEHGSELLADLRLCDEGPHPSSDNKQPVTDEVLGRLSERGSAYAVSLAKLGLRWKAFARPKFALFDPAREVSFDLPVEGDAALRIDGSLRPRISAARHLEFPILTSLAGCQGVLTSLTPDQPAPCVPSAFLTESISASPTRESRPDPADGGQRNRTETGRRRPADSTTALTKARVPRLSRPELCGSR